MPLRLLMGCWCGRVAVAGPVRDGVGHHRGSFRSARRPFVRENGAYFLTDVEGETEVGAFHRLEQTVAAAHAVFGGADFTVQSMR